VSGARTLRHCVPVASDAAAVEAASPGFIKAAMVAADTIEDNMRLLTYLELGRYTKTQLRHLYQEALNALPGLPEGSPQRANALLNIQHIRLFLARRAYTPCCLGRYQSTANQVRHRTAAEIRFF
jgi:hypothetical protein